MLVSELTAISLSHVDPNLLAAAILTPSHLSLNLPDPPYLKPLTDEQVIAIIVEVSHLSNAKNMILEMTHVDIPTVEYDLLKDFFDTGVKVTLLNCKIGGEDQYLLFKRRARRATIVFDRYQHDPDAERITLKMNKCY